MKALFLLGGLLFASCASAQDSYLAKPNSPPEDGECGTKNIQVLAKCACYKAFVSKNPPDILINACRQAFGDSFEELKKYCDKFRDQSSFDKSLDSVEGRCSGTYSRELENLTANANARENPPADAVEGLTTAARPVHGLLWPYPFYWCWGWGWWWWWWILRFYRCWYRYYRWGIWWWWKCRIYPWW